MPHLFLMGYYFMNKNILLNSNLAAFDVDFSVLTPKMFSTAYESLIKEADEEFKSTLKIKKPTYKDLFHQEKYEKLMELHHLLGSLNTLNENEELRDIEEKYTAILSLKISEWSLNSRMYNKTVKFTKSKEFKNLSEIRQKMIQKILKDLKESGIDLPQKEKKKLAKLNQKLAILGQKFQNNITDAQENLSFIVNQKELNGLSERAINNAKEIAKKMELPEGKFYIDEPSGLIDDVMSNSHNQSIRKKIYMKRRELCTKGKYNNTILIDKIYKLKQEIAEMLGYKDYAHMTLEESMAKTPTAALEFLDKLGNIALPYARKEYEVVKEEGQKLLKRKMEWWDSEYVANHMLKTQFKLDSEIIRLYFPVDKVVLGLFDICQTMFGVTFVENKNKNVWHEDVKFYDVFENGVHIGGIFMDLYKRNGKTPGAWLDPLCSYEKNDLKQTKPIAMLVCNAPKDEGQASTFELEEVVTLFHEMGHGLHHLLSKVEEEFYSGFNNVEHDAIEIPSQLMENLVYEYDVLKKISAHVKTGEKIPDEMIQKIINGKKFLGAHMVINMVRYSEMDMRLYMQKERHPYDLELEAMNRWKISEDFDPLRRRMPIFSHIFGGGYAAGYYAYQWAEVYAADGFAYLNSSIQEEKEERIKKYKEEVLYGGGEKSMSENYARFKPTQVDLKHLLNNYIDMN